MGSKTTNPSPVDPRERRIVLLGKTGAGKSSAGNTIFGGKKVFDTSNSSESVTDQCKSESMIIDGRKITLIDTPGFFGTSISENDLRTSLVNFLTESAEGIHAFLIVLPVRRFTEQEKEVLMEIKKVFSDEVFKYATVLFTHGDDLEDITIQDFVKQSDKRRELVQKCGDRCHVIDNKHWNKNGKNKDQVTELLKIIDQTVEKNGGNCYTNELLQAVQGQIEEEKMSMRNSGGKLSEEEINREAKARAKDKLAGIAAVVLLGAAFGGLTGIAAAKIGIAVLVGGIIAAVGGTAAAMINMLRGQQREEQLQEGEQQEEEHG